MRELTPEERDRLNRVRAGVPQLMRSIPQFMSSLAEWLLLAQPDKAIEHPREFAAAIDAFLASPEFVTLDQEHRAWLRMRLAYFAGEYLIRVHGGRWMIQEDPETPFFGKLVIDEFLPGEVVDVSQLAQNAFIRRSLQREFAILEAARAAPKQNLWSDPGPDRQ